MASSFLTRDGTRGPLHWEHGVSATRPPGKPPTLAFVYVDTVFISEREIKPEQLWWFSFTLIFFLESDTHSLKPLHDCSLELLQQATLQSERSFVGQEYLQLSYNLTNNNIFQSRRRFSFFLNLCEFYGNRICRFGIYLYLKPFNGRFFTRSKFLWTLKRFLQGQSKFLVQLNAPAPIFHTEASQVGGEIWGPISVLEGSPALPFKLLILYWSIVD